MKISWTELKSNEELLRIIAEKKCLVKEIRKRQLKFFGHILRREGMENQIATGMIEGRKGRRRPREKYIN